MLRAAGQRTLATGVGKAVTTAPVVWSSRAAEVADVAGSENPIIEAAGEGTFEIASSVAGRTAMRARESTLRKERENVGMFEMHPETGEEVRSKKDRERGRRRRAYQFGDGGTIVVERTGMLNESWRVTMELGQDTKTFNIENDGDVRGFESALARARDLAVGEDTDVTDEAAVEGTEEVEPTDAAAGEQAEQGGEVETPPDVDEGGRTEDTETVAGADTEETVDETPPPEVTPETEEGQEVTDEVTTPEETVTDEEETAVDTAGDAEVPTGDEVTTPPETGGETGDSETVPPVDTTGDDSVGTTAEDTVAELDRIIEESGKSLEEVLADHQRARQILVDYGDDITPNIQAGIDHDRCPYNRIREANQCRNSFTNQETTGDTTSRREKNRDASRRTQRLMERR